MDPLTAAGAAPTIVEWLTRAGPYAVTLIVLVWLFLERRERLAAQEDARRLRDDAIVTTKESTTAMGQFGEAMRDRLRAHDERIDRVLEKIEEAPQRRSGR